MIVLLVLAVLAGIAYPAYNSQVIATRRADGVALLYFAAQRQQQYFTANNAFTATVGTGGLEMGTSSNHGYYSLSVAATATTFTLTATRAGNQANDTDCGDLTLNHLGVKGISGGTLSAEQCW